MKDKIKTWKKGRIEIRFDYSKFHWVITKKNWKQEIAEFFELMWKGLGFIIGTLIVINFHWILILLLLIWLMFDFKVELR